MYTNHLLFKKCAKLTAIFLILQLFIGFASATDYYVSTDGNNSNSGLTPNTAWATPSYAATMVIAGDVVNLVNGTWYEEKIYFVNNGTNKKPIIIKAYNGTPTIDGIAGTTSSSDRGLDISNNEHIIIRGLKLLNYTHPLYIRYSNNISVYDSEFSNSIGGVAVVISSTDTYHTLINNCSIHDSGWNAIQIQGNREVPYGNGIASEYITITNNTIYDNNAHNQIDLFGNVKHVLIKDNLIYNSTYNGIYSHSITDNQWNVTIENNTIYNCSSGIKFENLHDSNIIRNQIYNMKVYGIYTGIESDNITFCENNISSKDLAFQVGDSNQRLVKNKLNDNAVYRFNNNGTFTLQDAVNENYTLILTNGANTTVEYTTNQVFTINPSNSAEVSNILYESNKSYLTIKSNINGTCSASIQRYPFHIISTKHPLKVISTNNTSLRVHSDLMENPAWIGISLPAYSNNCITILVDGVPYKSKLANSTGFVSFYYNDTWEKDREFTFETASPEDFFNTTVSGYIKSNTGSTIIGAFVSNNITSEIVITNSNGNYTFNVPANHHIQITASKEGYYSSSICVDVGKTNLSDINIILNQEKGIGPIINGLSAIEIDAYNEKIEFLTDIPSDTRINYGTSSLDQWIENTDFVTIHSSLLTHLISNTTYQYIVYTTDINGNTSTSGINTFKTVSEIPEQGNGTEDITPIKIVISNRTISPSYPFNIDIFIDPSTPISGTQLDFVFNSSKASVNNVTEGDLLKQSGAYTIFSKGTTDNSTGTVKNIYGFILGTSNVSTPGTMATVNLTAGSKTGIAEFSLSNVLISDADSKSVPYTVTNATVLIDTAPVMSTICCPKSVDEKSTLTFKVSAKDADCDRLTLSASGLPEGASFNKTSGNFTWTPAVGQAGVYTLTFEVSDGYLTDSENATVTVNKLNNPPVINSFKPLKGSSFSEGERIEISVNASDAEGQALNYSIMIDGVACSTGTEYVWETDYSSSGNHTIEVVVSDGIDEVKQQHTIYISECRPRYDVNEDGVVNILDVTSVSQKCGTTVSKPYPRYDVNQDGAVNILDLTLVGNHFGELVK